MLWFAQAYVPFGVLVLSIVLHIPLACFTVTGVCCCGC